MSKTAIRKQTDNFLYGIQGTSSFRFFPNDLGYDAGEPELTGAIAPILPMKIATVGSAGQRIEFTMLMNPESWNHGKTNASQASYTRGGWNVQLWGPNQDTISSTGKTAGMMIAGNGLESFLQEQSFAYSNLMSLVGAYRSNGYTFLDRTKTGEYVTRVINTIYGVQIFYDNQIFMGHFSNFSLEEDEEKPFILNYSFEFIISSLTGTGEGIRGHYIQLPVGMDDLSGGTAADPYGSTLVSDVFSGEPSYNLTPPRPTDDQTTQRYWTNMTGLPWSEALRLGLTDGSVKGNLALRNLMRSKKWDAKQKKFV